MAEQKVEDRPKMPPPPPRQPDGALKGYTERANTSRPGPAKVADDKTR